MYKLAPLYEAMLKIKTENKIVPELFVGIVDMQYCEEKRKKGNESKIDQIRSWIIQS